MPTMPLKNDVFSRCSSHATRCQYHCCWPKTASWKFEACWFLACAACRKRTTFSTFRSNTESLLLGSKEELKGTHSTTGTNWIYQSLSPTDAKGLELQYVAKSARTVGAKGRVFPANIRIDWVESKWPRANGRTRGYPWTSQSTKMH